MQDLYQREENMVYTPLDVLESKKDSNYNDNQQSYLQRVKDIQDQNNETKVLLTTHHYGEVMDLVQSYHPTEITKGKN